MKQYVYDFANGNKEMRELLGGKGANLAEMLNLGLSVPLGFTISTEACRDYYNQGEQLTESFIKEVLMGIVRLEEQTHRQFGDPMHPLLLSVRSGARESMPGMMNTILNIGLNDEIVEKWASRMTNPHFAYDSYRRLIQMYADVVMDLDASKFEEILTAVKQIRGVKSDTELNLDELKLLVESYKVEYKNQSRQDFPQDVPLQLIEAVKAVFRSWNTKRAKAYRELNHIPDDWGTAVNVQQMVYGNISEQSGTGVVFSRNPSTGEDGLFGEFMMNAQGEDIVAGIRTPMDIEKLAKIDKECYQELVRNAKILERHYKDMQDMEFTIENGKLYLLQTRNGKRTAKAAVKIATDMVKEGLLTKEEALLKVSPNQLDNLLHPSFDEKALKKFDCLAKGLAASPGAAVGQIYFSTNDLIKAKEDGHKDLILVRMDTSAEDIVGMHQARGVLTLRGGMTSHAAVVARGMGTCCVSGCEELELDEEKKILKKGKVILKEGDVISIDGTTGGVYVGSIPLVDPILDNDFKTFMGYAKEFAKIKVRANADTAKDALIALSFGAEGIGLCRSEHMFFEQNRLLAMRMMIIAKDMEERQSALDELLDYQREDYLQIFEEAKGAPVTIRYLDPPLHEFLPKKTQDIIHFAEKLKKKPEEVMDRIKELQEANPMMGHRGCRLSITNPEITIMQTRAIIEAMIICRRRDIPVNVELMIPLTVDTKEFDEVKSIIDQTANFVMRKEVIVVPYRIGSMIETPRACIVSRELAKRVEFYSFGTNDLTQLMYGISRDDMAKFVPKYIEDKVLPFDPFKHIDELGVGRLMRVAIREAKIVNPDIELGICGEHGGDPKSISFCHKIGLNYVSCSPYRVPIALIASARSAIMEEHKNRNSDSSEEIEDFEII